MNSNTIDTEYIILENLYTSSRQNPPLRQRDLAQLARTSLGMTNSILKRLIQKGWINAKRLNSRNIHYAVTLEGTKEIIHRSYGYFKRTIKNIAFYKEAIDSIISGAAAEKMNAVLLIGTSDLEFIVEHSCQYYGISFLKSADIQILGSVDNNSLAVFAEDIPVPAGGQAKHSYYLSQMLIKSAAVS
jgi:DNA-binding MarR family transcriptional regulator